MNLKDYKPYSDAEIDLVAVKEPGHGATIGVVQEKLMRLMRQARRANALASWAEANIPEMECRQDDECDHCFGLGMLDNYRGT